MISMHLNVEIKARTQRLAEIRAILLAQDGVEPQGLDHQIDSYFQVPEGRLKLREGNIENSLIYYERMDQAGPKASQVRLYQVDPKSGLKSLLMAALPVKKVVDKHREIFFIGNVKFHLDKVAGLGEFVEIEAIDTDGSHSQPTLEAQCNHYLNLLGIVPEELCRQSYSDMLDLGPK